MKEKKYRLRHTTEHRTQMELYCRENNIQLLMFFTNKDLLHLRVKQKIILGEFLAAFFLSVERWWFGGDRPNRW